MTLRRLLVAMAFEQVVCNQVTGGCDGCTYEQSSTHWKAQSCETTVLGWRKESINTLAVSFVMLDVSKPFDLLHRSLLLSKLRACGFLDSMVQLLNSYVCDQKYHLKLGRLVSLYRTVS